MITERAINRLAANYRGGGAHNLAYLEHAQEHFLKWMAEHELFTDGWGTAFKGGTAIRKFHLGHNGRFSTDLDFAIRDQAVATYVLDALKRGFEYDGVRFALDGKPVDDPGETHARWRASVPSLAALGSTLIAKLDFSHHGVWLPYQQKARAAINTIDAEVLGFEPVCPPLVDLRENLSEKLARFRRVPLARDVYDLVNLGATVRADMPLIRELVFLKVWGDVVITGRGTGPFEGGKEYCGLTPDRLGGKDEIGALVKPVIDWRRDLRVLCDIYGRAIGEPGDAREARLARCDAADKWWYDAELEAFRAKHAK